MGGFQVSTVLNPVIYTEMAVFACYRDIFELISSMECNHGSRPLTRDPDLRLGPGECTYLFEFRSFFSEQFAWFLKIYRCHLATLEILGELACNAMQ